MDGWTMGKDLPDPNGSPSEINYRCMKFDRPYESDAPSEKTEYGELAAFIGNPENDASELSMAIKRMIGRRR